MAAVMDEKPVEDEQPEAAGPPAGPTTWFDRGARALAIVRPELPQGYGCPLCLKWIPSAEHLAVEHVPPAHIGGRPLLLTCRWCNSRCGHELDYHIGAGQHVRDVFAGRASTRGHMTQYGRTLNAEITLGEERLIRIVEENNPRTVQAALEQTERDIATRVIPGDIDLHFEFKYNEWKEQVAWLRVGYLYAFALFGYRYGLQAVLGRIREQILHRPGDKLLSGLVRCVASPGVPKRLILVREPQSFRCVLVSLGDRLIFLPPLGGDASFYERMAALPEECEPFNFHGRLSFELPDRPIFGLDLYESFYREVYLDFHSEVESGL